MLYFSSQTYCEKEMTKGATTREREMICVQLIAYSPNKNSTTTNEETHFTYVWIPLVWMTSTRESNEWEWKKNHKNSLAIAKTIQMEKRDAKSENALKKCLCALVYTKISMWFCCTEYEMCIFVKWFLFFIKRQTVCYTDAEREGEMERERTKYSCQIG